MWLLLVQSLGLEDTQSPSASELTHTAQLGQVHFRTARARRAHGEPHSQAYRQVLRYSAQAAFTVRSDILRGFSGKGWERNLYYRSQGDKQLNISLICGHSGVIATLEVKFRALSIRSWLLSIKVFGSESTFSGPVGGLWAL